MLDPELFRGLGLETLAPNIEAQIANLIEYSASEDAGIFYGNADQFDLKLFMEETDKLIDKAEAFSKVLGYEEFNRESLLHRRIKILQGIAEVPDIVHFLKSRGQSTVNTFLSLNLDFDYEVKEELFSLMQTETSELPENEKAMLDTLMSLAERKTEEIKYSSGDAERVTSMIEEYSKSVKNFCIQFGNSSTL